MGGKRKPIAAPGDRLWYVYPAVAHETCPTCGHTRLMKHPTSWVIGVGLVESICWELDSLDYSLTSTLFSPSAVLGDGPISAQDVWAAGRSADDVFLTEAEANAEAARRNAGDHNGE